MKRIICSILSIILMVGLASCAPRETTVEKLVGVNFDEVDEILFFNGTTGKEYLCSDSEQIRAFLDQFKGVKVRLQDDQSPRMGGGINAHWYKDGKEIGVFSYTEGRLVNDRAFYDLIPAFSREDYNKWYDKINELGQLAPGGIQ